MQIIFLVLLLCLLTSISRIFLKKGMVKSNALTGMVASLLVGWLALVSACLLYADFSKLTLRGGLFFALIGIVAPPAVRYLTYKGIDSLGAARSDPLRSLTPFFAILFAGFFLPKKSALSL